MSGDNLHRRKLPGEADASTGEQHQQQQQQQPPEEQQQAPVDGIVIPEVTHRRSDDFWSTLAGVAGNVLEWYDFAVFGFFGDVIGDVFFPPQSGHSATMESFLVFGGAFLMRPVGGMLLGYVGDLYGPKKALIISIFLMAFPTFAMGCLPSYAQIGPMAIVLLVFVRLLQGLSVGGQLMSSLVFTLESHDHSQWGLYGSYVMAAANFGTLLGALAGSILESALTAEQLLSWGWRVPFWSGIVVSLSGFYLRSHGGDGGHEHALSEARAERHHVAADTFHDDYYPSSLGEEEVDATDTPALNPVQKAFQGTNLRPLLAASLVPMLWSAGFYLSFVWMAIYMKDLIDTPVPNAFAVNSMSLLLSVCFFFPYAGILSDRFGRRKIMVFGGSSLGVLSPFLVMLIGRGSSLLAFLSQCVLGIALSCWGAPMCAWLVESFEPEARLTSVAIGYNVAQAIAGGSTPFLATLLVDNASPNAPGLILTALAAVGLFGLLVVAPDRESVTKTQSFNSIPTDAIQEARRLDVELSNLPQIPVPESFTAEDRELL